MVSRCFSHTSYLLVATIVSMAFVTPGASAQEEGARKTPFAWTLDESMAQLRLYPNDLYLQYAALQLARQEGRRYEVEKELERLRNALRPQWAQRTERVNLFSMMSGSLAVQESLQLDALRGQGRSQPSQPSTVSLAQLQGPTIKSHPWNEMLAGRRPETSLLARSVPDDFYFIQFRSLNKLLEVLDTGDLWGTHLFSQTRQAAYTHLVSQRIQQQLAVETHDLLRPFYDLAISEVAVTGSDLYAVEGSDVTLLFRYSQAPLFKAQMDGFLVQAENKVSKVTRTTGQYRDIPFVHLSAPDRSVHVYSAYPVAGIHVRSNSQVAFERVIDTITRSGAQKVRSLGSTDEFAYIRTLMPYGAEEEDGLIYFSDPFIRRLVGPQLKLTERRRVLCAHQLRMIGHAAALHRTQQSAAADALSDLAKSDWAQFGDDGPRCPCGGTYRLASDGLTGVCSHHGGIAAMVPCCEIPLKRVSELEAKEYGTFVTNYNRYWRTFFDPIAVRIKVAEKQYRIETIVLPLIDNSIYSAAASVLGGEPQPLDALPVPKRNIFSVAAKIDKRRLLQESGWEPAPRVTDAATPADPLRDRRGSQNNLKQLGLAMHNYHDTHKKLPTVANYDAAGRSLLSWRVHLLPYLDAMELYEQFHLDEPWDSEHNKKLIEQMPPVYFSPGRQKTGDCTTTYLLPTGDSAMFSGTAKHVAFRDITDGTSNTMMIVDAAEKHATIWTRPGDLVVEQARIRDALFDRFSGDYAVVGFGDGSVAQLPKTIEDDELAASFTRNGGEPVAQTWRRETGRRRQRDPFGLDRLVDGNLDQRKLYDFLAKGVGNRIGLHAYDADPLFDFQLVSFLGQAAGNFSGRRAFWMDDDFLPVVLLIASLNSPVYVSLPLDDVDVTDEFLLHVDDILAEYVRKPQRFSFFQFEDDFYKLSIGDGQVARSVGIRFGPVKWRFFWARIEDALYVASKPSILEDLAAMAGKPLQENGADAPLVESSAHAMLRIRPDHWNQVLPAYRLGWAESHRLSCLDNVGRLSSLARLAETVRQEEAFRDGVDMTELAKQLHGVQFYCPEGGQYVATEDGKHVACSIHGSADQPRQSAIPHDNGSIDQMLRDFRGLTVTLTFLEDGLHAVLTIDRK